MTGISLSQLTEALEKRAARAQLSQSAPRSKALRAHLETRYHRRAGQKDSFLADPVLEARFGWRTAEPTMGELSGELLHPRLVAAMDAPPKEFEEQRFERQWSPFEHQLAAWQALKEKSPRSVLVSSGTGSGKTECFLVPVLDDLARQAEASARPLFGVQALLLYPLNALINSQRDRLSAWTRGLEGKVRFCLYNGETRKSATEAEKRPYPSEVIDRKTLRQEPPPILVTNTTMLEYMLVRRIDAPILQASRGKLRWIVIDEAHTYLGSQAAELSLLLRRVMRAFDVSPQDVRFVATSATISSEGADAEAQLSRFLADLAGTDQKRVRVIQGSRSIPDLPTELAERDEPLPPWTELRSCAASDPAKLFNHLTSNRATRELRQALAKPKLAGTRLSSLERLLQRYGGPSDRLLELLDLCATAERSDHRFLPLRAHLFHRTSSGLWACVNPNCNGRTEHLEDESWPFGKVFLDRRDRCRCGSKVFEIVLCRGCGEEYLAVEESRDSDGGYTLCPRLLEEPASNELDEELEEDGDEVREASLGRFAQLLLTAPTGGREHVGVMRMDPHTGRLCHAPDGFLVGAVRTAKVKKSGKTVSRLTCAHCGAHEDKLGSQFRPARTGAPFFLSSAIPTLLEHLPSSEKSLPSEGRRLITFSDSRQGTARFALRSQGDAERNYVRSWLYHQVLSCRSSSSGPFQKENLQAEIDAYQQFGSSLPPVLAAKLKQAKAELAALSRPSTGRLSWQHAERDLGKDPIVSRWLARLWEDQAFTSIKKEDLPQLLLLRELARRPKFQNSLESLGLLALDYPEFCNSKPPAAWRRRFDEAQDWRDFLCLTMDFFIRAYSIVDVDDRFRPWLGQKIRLKVVHGPGGEITAGDQILWPTARRVPVRQRLARLLAEGLSLSLDSAEDRALITELLESAWEASKRLLPEVAGGRRLRLHEAASLVEVERAWLCPVTRRLLPRTFRGITPYLTARFSRCRPVRMPRIPAARWKDASDRPWTRENIFDWLEENEEIRELRSLGVWSDLSDRLVMGASYYRTAEHSAQQSGDRLRELETDFKVGKVNLLSCSTTMEMGVDIGGLSMVAMNNVPPSPANFLQRAGRAGRRDEPIAVSFTLCKATPHGEAVFADPTWPFRTPIHVPRVSLESERIARRHVHAVLLARYFGKMSEDVSHERLTVKWFFDKENASGPTPSRIFREDLESKEIIEDEALAAALQTLVQGTALEGCTLRDMAEPAVREIERIEKRFQEEIRGIRQDLEAAKSPHIRGETPEEKAIKFQLNRFEQEYLLTELTQQGFLPGYGFPTQVVPFIHTTAKHFEAQRRRAAEESSREDNRARWRSYPSRQLSMALRDYAPGNEVVLDGRVYQSQGVTLHWHVPAGDDKGWEAQLMPWAWRCRACHSSGTFPSQPQNCPSCGSHDIRKKLYLEPTGFAVGIRYQPHNDITYPPYLPVEEPWITAAGGRWTSLPDRRWGRFRYSAQGSVLHFSRGLQGHGYALCLRCGRAASESEKNAKPQDPLPAEMINHKKLRRGRKDQGTDRCRDDRIKRGIWLAADSETDVFELQLRRETGESISKTAAYSLAVALRGALAEKLGVDPREIGCAAVEAERGAPEDPRSYSLVLFDTASGGAGFVGAVAEALPELLIAAQETLECLSRECSRACHACLLTYDSQHRDDLLDRFQALDALQGGLIESMCLPKAQRLFGDRSKVLLNPLDSTVRLEGRRPQVSTIELYLGEGSQGFEAWDLPAWPLFDHLFVWKSQGKVVRLLIAEPCLDHLSAESQGILAGLLLAGIDIRLYREEPAVQAGHILAQLSGTGFSRVWSSVSVTASAPGELWGVPAEDGAFLVEATLEKALEPTGLRKADSTNFVMSGPDGAVEIQIRDELNGSVDDFGKRFWDFLAKGSAHAKEALGASAIDRILYEDRYLRSPLPAKLLYEVLAELKRRGFVDSETDIEIRTTEPRAAKQPRRVDHDWLHPHTAQIALEGTFGTLGRSVRVKHKSYRDTPHWRQMSFCFRDGRVWTVRLDQGFGFWGSCGFVAFPFDEPEENQSQWLQSQSFQVWARHRGHATAIYDLGFEGEVDSRFGTK